MNSPTRRVLLTWVLGPALAGCATQGNDGAAVADPSFEHWCDSHLCDWRTDEGSYERTGTWHKKDLAVSFLDTPTTISQLLKLDGENAPCILFDTIADVVLEAQVSLALDFNDDGIPDIEQQIAVLHWQPVPFVVRAPVAYDGVRVSVTKNGTGRAVLAQMRVVVQPHCSGNPLTLDANSVCTVDAVCKSGRCEDGHCQPCSAGNCASLTPAPESE
jgi:hypothetical protein